MHLAFLRPEVRKSEARRVAVTSFSPHGEGRLEGLLGSSQAKFPWGRDVKRSFLCVILFVGAFIALDETAAAVEIAIDDTKIELVGPAGYCPLDRKDWPKSQPIDFTPDGIKNQGERLAYFVDCERVGSWHEGSSSEDAGNMLDYQASLNFRDQNVTRAMLKELCAALRKADDSAKGLATVIFNAMKNAVLGRFGGGEDTTLTYGVLGYEDTGCYVLRFSQMKNQQKVYSVSVLTIIKSKLVTGHLIRKIGNMDLLKGNAESVIKDLDATSRPTAAALIAANR
jgi:hypothetical protein